MTTYLCVDNDLQQTKIKAKSFWQAVKKLNAKFPKATDFRIGNTTNCIFYNK